MSWSYSGDPTSSDKDEVRFYLQDTDASTPYMTDEEIDFLIAEWQPRFDNNIGIAAVAAERLADRYAGVVDVVADGVKAAISALSDNFVKVAMRLRNLYVERQSTGEVDIANLMVGMQPDMTIQPTIFGVHMHDNPEAGQQDYGGTWPIIYWPEYNDGLNTYIG